MWQIRHDLSPPDDGDFEGSTTNAVGRNLQLYLPSEYNRSYCSSGGAVGVSFEPPWRAFATLLGVLASKQSGIECIPNSRRLWQLDRPQSLGNEIDSEG